MDSGFICDYTTDVLIDRPGTRSRVLGVVFTPTYHGILSYHVTLLRVTYDRVERVSEDAPIVDHRRLWQKGAPVSSVAVAGLGEGRHVGVTDLGGLRRLA